MGSKLKFKDLKLRIENFKIKLNIKNEKVLIN